MQQPKWLAHAWTELGQREIAGNNHNPEIVSFFRESGHDWVKDDETAWCAAFVGACLTRAGIKSSGSLRARSYLKWGKKLHRPKPGAIAVFSRGRNPALGHVGFVVGGTPGQILILGGNQSNAVTVAGYDKSRLLGFRWPDTPCATEPESIPDQKNGDLFDEALAHVLKMEGGYTNDPHDPGGPTNKGITLQVFADWTKTKINNSNRNSLIAELKRIPDPVVAKIYKQRYWQRAGCPKMPASLAFMHFDAAVNHGVRTAIKTLQEAVGARIDGEIGPETNSRIARMPVFEIVKAYAKIRQRRYRALPHFWRFGRGWLNRVNQTLKRAEELGKAPPNANSKSHNNKQGRSKMATKFEQEHGGKWWGESMTIWGAIITALATVLPALGPILGLDITGELIRQLGDGVVEVVQALGGVIGIIMTIIGRGRASGPLLRREVSVRV